MTSFKMVHRLSPALFLLYIGPASASGGADDLNTAFVATLGQPAPVVRHLAGPAAHTFWGNTLDGEIDITLSLEPQFLVPLGGARYALLIHETTRTLAGGAPLNAVTVAYLDRTDGGWAVEHVWFEAGGLGLAGNEGQEIKSFGAAPLYFGHIQWCGSDSCSETMAVLALDPAGPKALGEIKGRAVYPVDFPDIMHIDCESTNYTATVGPPTSRQNRFSITYEGWTAPVGKMLPRHKFRLTADAVVSGSELVTGLKTPDCMR
jgi:hypothetical protein